MPVGRSFHFQLPSIVTIAKARLSWERKLTSVLTCWSIESALRYCRWGTVFRINPVYFTSGKSAHGLVLTKIVSHRLYLKYRGSEREKFKPGRLILVEDLHHSSINEERFSDYETGWRVCSTWDQNLIFKVDHDMSRYDKFYARLNKMGSAVLRKETI